MVADLCILAFYPSFEIGLHRSAFYLLLLGFYIRSQVKGLYNAGF
jgi:hypothetical protein